MLTEKEKTLMRDLDLGQGRFEGLSVGATNSLQNLIWRLADNLKRANAQLAECPCGGAERRVT